MTKKKYIFVLLLFPFPFKRNQPPKAPTSGASQTSGAGFSYVQKVVKAPLKKELSANKYSEMNPEDLEGEVRKIMAAFEVSSDDTILSETVLRKFMLPIMTCSK